MFEAGLAAANTPFSTMRSKSAGSHHVQWAAVVGTSSTPMLAKYWRGVRPSWRCLHSSCSLFVSEACRCMRRPFSFTTAAISLHVCGFDVYSAWML